MSITNPFDSEEFDAICYAYRSAQGHLPTEVAFRFEAVKTYCRRILSEAQRGAEPAFDALHLAIMFHHTYERLAPDIGYDTRKETRIFDPDSPNGKLMVAVCAELLPKLYAAPSDTLSATDLARQCRPFAPAQSSTATQEFDTEGRFRMQSDRYSFLRGEAYLHDIYDTGANHSSWEWTISLPTGKSGGKSAPSDTPSFDETVTAAMQGETEHGMADEKGRPMTYWGGAQSDTLTPDTDAATTRMERLDGDFDDVVSAKFAAQLERQRNELRSALEAAEARVRELTP